MSLSNYEIYERKLTDPESELLARIDQEIENIEGENIENLKNLIKRCRNREVSISVVTQEYAQLQN
jgi:hypothetical protein